MPLEDLLKAAQGGDRQALGSLLEQCSPELRGRLAHRIDRQLQSVLSVEDVLQVTFLEAFLGIQTFQPTGPDSFISWMHRIAENNLLDAVRELRAGKRPDPGKRMQAPSDSSAVALFEILTGTTTSPSGQMARSEAFQALESAMRRLPADYERVIRLYDLEGLDAVAVAQEMGRSEGAIFMLRARAQERLRDLLPSASKLMSDSA